MKRNFIVIPAVLLMGVLMVSAAFSFNPQPEPPGNQSMNAQVLSGDQKPSGIGTSMAVPQSKSKRAIPPSKSKGEKAQH